MSLPLVGILYVATIGMAEDTPLGAAQAFADQLAIGTDAAVVESALETHCEYLTSVVASPVRFPLARDHEQHLVGDGFRTRDGNRLDRSAFTLAD